MADVTENDLRAAVKALVDVVTPAVSKSDPLALEQLRLVTESLEFVRSRLDRLYDRDRFDLDHHLEMARALEELRLPLIKSTADLLDRTLAVAGQVQALPGAASPDLKSATAGLAAAAREIIRQSAGMPPELRSQVERCVLDCSERRIEFERAWFLPMGFDPAPGEVRPLAELLTASSGT